MLLVPGGFVVGAEPTRPLVFLSHATTEKPWVRRVLGRLKALDRGAIRWFYDVEELRVGDDVQQKIDAALDVCRVLIVFATPDSIARPWVQREISRARTKIVVLGRGRASIPGLPPTTLIRSADGLQNREAVVWEVVEVCRRECGLPPPDVGQRMAHRLATALPVGLVVASLGLHVWQMARPTALDIAPSSVVSITYATDAALRQDGHEPGDVPCHAYPVPMPCIATGLDLLEAAGANRVALDLDVGGRLDVLSLRGPGEIDVLRDALAKTKLARVFLVDPSPTQLLGRHDPCPYDCFTAKQTTRPGSEQVIGVPLTERSRPLGLLLGSAPEPPMGAGTMVLPWRASEDVQRAVYERDLETLAAGDLDGEDVIFGARFPLAERPDGVTARTEVDRAPLPDGPLLASEETFFGSHIHALVMWYARGGDVRWAPHSGISFLFVFVAFLGGIAWRSTPVVLLGVWVLWGGIGISTGWVLPVLPPLVLAGLDVVYRRWVW